MEAAATLSQSSDHEAPSYYDEYEQHYHQHAAEQEESAAAAAVDALNAAAQHVVDLQQQQHQQQLEQEAGSLLAPLLLVTTVDIGDGKADRIEVRQGDVPLEVANAFVSKHGLPTAVVPRLAMHLEENLLKVEVQRRAAGCGSQAGDDEEGLAVFHRLYQQAVALRRKMEMRREDIKKTEIESILQNKTTMSWISSEMMRDRSAGPFDNYGEMLYAESLESLARKRDKAQRVKAQRDMEEVQGVTFHPEISRHAQTIWGPHEVGSVPVWQRLSKVKMTKAQERLEMLRREKEEAEVRECTFKPQISGRSEKLMTERSQTLRSLNVSAHQQLYQDAIRRQQKQQDYQHWYPEEVTFQPKLNESAMSREFLRKSLQKEGSSLGPNASGAERHMALVNRLYASYEKLQNKLSEARSTLQNSIDPNTGKRLFHPETGRAPRFSRNTSQQPVSEYLYSLSQQQEEKHKAAAAERERRQKEEAAASKAATGSKQLVKQLQHKRFKQIFDFLDVDGLGAIDLVAIIGSGPEWLDDLDDEVRADLESAAKLLQKRALKHADSSNSNVSGSTIFMPPPPPGLQGFAGVAAASSSADGSMPPTPTSCAAQTAVSFSAFCGLLEEVLATRRGPRAYLAPSPAKKYMPTETYKPQINQRSKQLASRVRPKDTPAYEVLYQENSIIQGKLTERRAQQEVELSKKCTFAPQLVSQQLVKEGRVMRAVREGSWWARADTDSQLCELEGVASLQQLAAVMGDEQPEDKQPESPAAAQQHEAQEVCVSSEGSPAPASPPPDGFSSREEQQQYLDLEREVQEMQRMLEEATAAAERGQQSHSDQQYLSEILGLAQEQVDAMAPALSALQGISSIKSRDSPAAGVAAPQAAAAEPPAAAAVVAAPSRGSLLQHTPKSSFKVTDGADGSSAATGPAPPAAGTADVPPPGSLSGASPGQLQHAVTAALQELSSSSDAEFVSKALALSKMAAAGGFSTASVELSNHSALIAAGGKSGKLQGLSELPASSALLAAAAVGRRSSGKLASINLEGADLFELAAGAGAEGQQQLQQQLQQHSSSSQHDLPAGSAALESLEELAAAMHGILADRQ